MYRSGKIILLLSLTLLSAGCLANATPNEATYKSNVPGSNSNLVLTGDGIINDGSTEDVYIWTSSDGTTSGKWYKSDTGDMIFLNMGSFFNDLPLSIVDDSIIWPNGSEWLKV